MASAKDDRPIAMMNVVWRQYRALALTARATKASQESARKWTLWLAFAGGGLSTLAGVSGAGVLGVLAAILLAVAAYIGKELLSSTREDEWVRCRVLAEALKRDVYKALVQVSPYDGPTAGAALGARVKTLLQNSGLDLNAAVFSRADEKKLPEVSTVEDYVRERVRDQIDKFYGPKAAEHEKRLRLYEVLSLVLGGAAAVMSAVGAKFNLVALWVPVVTTATAGLTTLVQAQRLQGLVPLYQQTKFQLDLALASWTDQANARAALPLERLGELTAEFVNRCEDIMSQENEAWRAEWESKEKKGSVEAFVKQLEETKT